MSKQLDFTDAIKIAKGCHDYNGGHQDQQTLDAYHHGIDTVITALERTHDTELTDYQCKVLHKIGSE